MTSQEQQPRDNAGAGADQPERERLAALPRNLDEKQQAIYDQIAKGKRGTVRGPLALMLHSPGIAEHAQSLGEAVRYGTMFPPRLSEFMIAIVARHYDCDYEWSVHAPIARDAGVPASVLQAIGEGRMPVFDDEEQADIYDYVSSLLARHDIADDVFFRFKVRFGERGIIDVAALIGYYGLVANILNSVRFPPLGDPLPRRQG